MEFDILSFFGRVEEWQRVGWQEPMSGEDESAYRLSKRPWFCKRIRPTDIMDGRGNVVSANVQAECAGEITFKDRFGDGPRLWCRHCRWVRFDEIEHDDDD